MNLKSIRKCCTPAQIYFYLSITILLFLTVQNLGNRDIFCIGDYECDVDNTWVIIFFKAVYIIFWTFILNLLCKNGHTTLSWFLLLFPFLLAFILIGLIIFNGNPRKHDKNKLHQSNILY
tara:strand:- start:7053 stop:7412 length:360 start_codon:yes stop_codon:yes gene_type:complete